jgi:hypothetical protein
MTIITPTVTLSTWGVIDDVGDGQTWQLWSVRHQNHPDRLGFVALPLELTTDDVLVHPLVSGITV